jgi:Protein of unknown function (DUF3450)
MENKNLETEHRKCLGEFKTLPLLNFFTLLGVILGGLPAFAQEAATPAVAREKVAKWVETRKLISEESARWEAEKQMLSDLDNLRQREAKQMDEVIDLAKERVTDVEKLTNELSAEEKSRLIWRSSFEKRITALEDALIPQLAFLPPPVAAKVLESITRLEERNSREDLQSRFRDVLAILNEVIAFNHQLYFTPEIRTIDGKEIEVDVLYLGLTQAWYVDRTGEKAGTGRATKEGWTWIPDSAIARQVRRAIDIHTKKEAPAYTRLPLGDDTMK